MTHDRAYRPSNGSEGTGFIARWCDRCRSDQGGEAGCAILSATMAFQLSDPEYPSEWRWNERSGPRCTAFDAIDPFQQPFDPAAAIGLLL